MPRQPRVQSLRHRLQRKNLAAQPGVLDFPGEPRCPCFGQIRILAELRQKKAPRNAPDEGVGARDRIAMIDGGKDRCFGQDVARPGSLQDKSRAAFLVADELHLTRGDEKEAFYRVTLVKQIAAGFEPVVSTTGRFEERGNFIQHDAYHVVIPVIAASLCFRSGKET